MTKYLSWSGSIHAPGKDLLSENIIISNYGSHQWTAVPLDSLYLIVPDNGFFIGVEWLITNELKNYHLSIGQTDALKTENSFVRWGNTVGKNSASFLPSIRSLRIL